MAATLVSAPPFIPVRPVIKITSGTDSVEFECAAESFEVTVDQDESTTETFCGTYTTYKAEVWTITGTVFPSYGTAGLWNNLRPMAGLVTTFEFLPDASKPAGPDNPKMSGSGIVKAFAFYTGSPGEPASFDVVIAVQGAPTFSTAAGAAATGANAGTPGTWVPVGATPPANAAAATSGGVTAVPSTSWTTGQYVQGSTAGSGGEMYWNGTAWTAGRKP